MDFVIMSNINIKRKSLYLLGLYQNVEEMYFATGTIFFKYLEPTYQHTNNKFIHSDFFIYLHNFDIL